MICLCKAEEFFSVSGRIFWKGSQFLFNLAHIRNWERYMNLCRALQSCYLSEVLADGGGVGGYLFWGFRVTASCFGGGRARGCDPRVVRRRLICFIKIGGWWLKGPFRGFRFGFFCNGGGEENLIGRTVLAERRTASKVPEVLTIGDLWPLAIPFEEVSEIW